MVKVTEIGFDKKHKCSDFNFNQNLCVFHQTESRISIKSTEFGLELHFPIFHFHKIPLSPGLQSPSHDWTRYTNAQSRDAESQASRWIARRRSAESFNFRSTDRPRGPFPCCSRSSCCWCGRPAWTRPRHELALAAGAGGRPGRGDALPGAAGPRRRGALQAR